MKEISFEQLAELSKIEPDALLKHIQQSYPNYQGQNIDERTAYAWIPNLRKNHELTLHESIRLGHVLSKFSVQMGDPASSSAPPRSTLITNDTALVNDRDNFKTMKRGNKNMNNNYDTETNAKNNWDSDTNLRAEFGNDFEAYLAYCDAADRGLTKSYISREVGE